MYSWSFIGCLDDIKLSETWEEKNIGGSLTRIGVIWSFGVATATIFIIILGTQQRDNQPIQNQKLKFQIYVNDKIMGKPEMIMLDGTNYRTWKGKMEDLFYVKELADPIENGGAMPVSYTEKVAEWKRLDRKAVGFIRQWVGDNVIHHVEEESTAYGVWSKLDALYANKNAVNKVRLIVC